MSRALTLPLAGGLLLVLLAAASGCIKLPAFTKSEKTIDFYTLEYSPPDPVREDPLAGVVLVRRITPASMYGTDRMVTRGAMFTTEFSYYRRWAATPASMITDFLYRDLSNSGLFAAVLSGSGFLRPQYEISGTLEAMETRHGIGGWRTALTVQILFFPSSPDKRIQVAERVFQRRYQIAAPAKDGSAESIVASLSRCMEDLSRQLIQDLQTHLLQQTENAIP